jgi:omptin family protein
MTPIVPGAIATLVTTAVLFLAVPASAQIQPFDAPGTSATVSTNVWWSFGRSTWEQDVQGILGSKLDWKDVDSPVVMVTGDFAWRYLVLSAGVGWGQAVTDGTFVDDDFIQGGPVFSHTESTAPDSRILLFSADAGFRPLRWRDSQGRPGFVGVLAGYQFWREEYEAFGASGSGLFGPIEIPSNVKVITHEWKWQSVRIGGRFDAPFWRDFNFRLSAFFLPWSSLEVRDIHHLRDDLAQNPSFISTATGGFGYQLDGSLTYTFFHGLAVEAGFRYWKVDMHDGRVKVRFSDGTTFQNDLVEASTKRYGPYVGLTYRF